MKRAYLDIETTGLSRDNCDLTVVGIAIEQGRELQVLQFVGDQITPEDLPTEIVSGAALPTGLRAAVEEFERRHVAWVLRAAGGNREQAATMLEIDPATL